MSVVANSQSLSLSELEPGPTKEAFSTRLSQPLLLFSLSAWVWA